MTSTFPDLPVPDEARRVFAEQHGLTPPGSAGRRVDWDAVDRDIRALAAPMIAAELRRLQALALDRNKISEMWGLVRARADELDPEETP